MARRRVDKDVSALEFRLADVESVLRPQGKLAEAEGLRRELLALQRKLDGNEPPPALSQSKLE